MNKEKWYLSALISAFVSGEEDEGGTVTFLVSYQIQDCERDSRMLMMIY